RVAAAAIPAIPESAAGGLALVLAAGGRTIRVDAGSAAAAEVTRAVSPLLAAARPVSAVQVRAARMAPPGGPSVLGLTFTSLGVEPAVVQLDAEAVRLIDPAGSWREVPPPRMGLVEGAGHLLDGLYAPATIPPGTTGAWVLAGADAQPGERVRAGGTVRLTGPRAASSAFEVSTTVDVSP
ncbi:MAG: hypothetical protein V7603_4911, partial [Micromonosporaceae bacterium]